MSIWREVLPTILSGCIVGLLAWIGRSLLGIRRRLEGFFHQHQLMWQDFAERRPDVVRSFYAGQILPPRRHDGHSPPRRRAP